MWLLAKGPVDHQTGHLVQLARTVGIQVPAVGGDGLCQFPERSTPLQAVLGVVVHQELLHAFALVLGEPVVFDQTLELAVEVHLQLACGVDLAGFLLDILGSEKLAGDIFDG